MNLKEEIIKYVSDDSILSFEDLSFETFKQQSQYNQIYKSFLEIIGKNKFIPSSVSDIPLLPISVFKTQTIKTNEWPSEIVFKSSGNQLNGQRSKHHLKDIEFYNKLSLNTFKSFYKDEDYTILALLPSYLENGDSSLVHMVRSFVDHYNEDKEVFYMYNFKELYEKLLMLKAKSKNVILFGVSFALIDFCAKYQLDFSQLSIVFTGGMKNRKREMTYQEIYSNILTAFPLSSVDSEYGMTELISQAYCINNKEGKYTAGSTLRILAKELNDPFQDVATSKTGQLGFIDLGNQDSVSFVLTDDLCVLNKDMTFNILGRLTYSDLRGCNLLYQN